MIAVSRIASLRRVITALVLVVLSCALPIPQASAGRFDWLPDNTWVKMTLPTTTKYVCHNFVDCTLQKTISSPIGREFSGVAYGDGLIYYFGGGHGGHPGNDVEIYSVATNTWSQLTVPEGLPTICLTNPSADPACLIMGGGGTTTITPQGKPYTEHMYQRSAYDPIRRWFISGCGSGTWAFDPATARWTRLTPNLPPSSGIETKCMVFDPDAGTVLWFATTNYATGVYAFDYSTNTWVRRSSIPSAVTWSNIYTAYDSDQHKHLISHGSAGFWFYDARSNSWSQLTNVPMPKATSLSYDSMNKVFLLARGDEAGGSPVEFWTFDGRTRWTQLTSTGTLPIGPAWWNPLVYDAQDNVFFFVNLRYSSTDGAGSGGNREGDVETWVYRYKYAPGVADSIAPSPPRTLRTSG